MDVPALGVTALGRKRLPSFFGSGRSNWKCRLPLNQTATDRIGRGVDGRAVHLCGGISATAVAGLQSRVRPLYAAYAPVVDTHVANGRFFVTDGLDSALAGHFAHGGFEIVRALIGEPTGQKSGNSSNKTFPSFRCSMSDGAVSSRVKCC